MDRRLQHEFEDELFKRNDTVGHRFWFTRSKLLDFINRVNVFKQKENKQPGDYNFLKRYDVVTIGNVDKLVLAGSHSSLKFFVCLEELYDVIRDAHVACGHGGEKRTEKELDKTYANITREQIKLFLARCQNCQLKKSKHNKGVVVRPIMSSRFNSRGQVDLIDLQSQPDGDYRYIADHIAKINSLSLSLSGGFVAHEWLGMLKFKATDVNTG